MKTAEYFSDRRSISMKKMPISIIIDDSAPLVHIFGYARLAGPVLNSGEVLLKDVPTDFLKSFCDVVEEYGVSGKFSIVPMPACRGDISKGIKDYNDAALKEWLDIARTRLSPYFDFCPEMITHHKALDLETGSFMDINEQEWVATQKREAIAKYISRALEIMRDADVTPTGVTSPWTLGEEVEDDYAAAICDAFYNVLGKKKSWYFLHNDTTSNGVRPKVRFREEDRCVVEVVRTVNDAFWLTMENSRTDDEYISEIADMLITKDGKAGQIPDALARDSYPILVTHWQSLYSNGRYVGFKAFCEVLKRIKEHLDDRVIWKNFSYLMDEAIKAE